MSEQFKKVCAVHDLSCFGRCALTVILPTLSRYGIQAVPIPTALLSTHTGGFQNIFFEDLTDRMKMISNHLKEVGAEFDAIYTGFLGSVNQIDTVIDIAESFNTESNILLVDPVMGDDGKLYSTYNDELVEGIRRLSHHADVLTPNLTEACLLTDTDYPHGEELSSERAEKLAHELSEKLHEKYPNADIAITGIVSFDKVLTVASRKNGEIHLHEESRLPISFPGTGDLFASLLLAEILEGKDFISCVSRSAALTSSAVRISQKTDEPIRNGVLLEKFLRETEII